MPKVAFSDSYVTIWRGTDCRLFLDGLSSNQIVNLDKNCVVQTAILNNNAKIIDLVTIINFGEFLAIIGYMPNFQSMLDFVTPRILQSDVSISDISNLNDVVISYDQNNDSGIGTCETKDDVTYAKVSNNMSYCIAAKKVNLESEPMGEEFHEWRISNLVPWYGYEINSKVIPYKCGINELVHESKGCFTGQEILTRMRTRNRGIKVLKSIDNLEINSHKVTTRGLKNSLMIENQ
tara:strand:+ start:450 stop:1154 length:705 start_codon:yes stop_codon:yes gene_type:complete